MTRPIAYCGTTRKTYLFNPWIVVTYKRRRTMVKE